MKVITKFFWNCGRSGNVEGLFVCDKEELEQSIGKKVYFGEILGKHSDVYGALKDKDFTIQTEDQDFIEKFIAIFGSGTISGYNPLEYFREEDEE